MTSARILAVRLALAFVNREPVDLYIGQLKTHLTIQPLPDYSEVVARWDMARVLDSLVLLIDEADLALLRSLVGVLNTESPVESLQEHDRWRDAPPRPLDVPWPT